MYTTHLAYINDKHNSAKRTAYCRTKQQAQVKLREMKNRWWQATTELLQMAVDHHDMKTFYGGLRGLRPSCSRLCTGQIDGWNLIY